MNLSKDQRLHLRMTMNTPVNIKMGLESFTAICIDVSATGVLLHSTIFLKKGNELLFDVTDENFPIPTMKIKGKVIRCDQLSVNDYEVAIVTT